MNLQLKANMMMLIVNAFWGLSYVFMKMGLGSLGIFNLIALRFLIAFFVAGVLLYKPLIKMKQKTIVSSFILGMVLFCVLTLVTFGVSMTSASNAGFLVSLTVIFVPLISSLLMKRLPAWPIRMGLVVTLTGIGILTLKQSLSFHLGDLLCIGGALCYAIHIILTGKLTNEDNPLTIGVLQLGFAGFIALICSTLFEIPSLPTTLHSWTAILGLGIFCSAIGFVCQTIAQRYTTPTHTGLIFATEPLFAAIFAVCFLGEIFSLKELIGALIVISGIFIAQLDKNAFLKRRFFYQRRYRRKT
ncbi:DMT family transporter [Bacillus swezeyi]|uniref:DMT family transporter n=1 Tax=Bacillus swezeyi TaxID=1925020 RepID=UPI0027DBEDB7|nr:DMT family transporter [Bacillus swezeyi]